MSRTVNTQHPGANCIFGFIKKSGWITFTFALIIGISSCASSNHHTHKKLKRGKPIPCPLKDC